MKSQKCEPVSAAVVTIPLAEATDSLSRLFADHYRRVLIAGYRITGNMADAEDVAQAVFLRLGRSDAVGLSNPASYLYRAAINGALDLLRRRKAAATEPLEAAAAITSTRPDGSPDAEATNRELGRLLREAISELPARAAEMFALRYLEEMGNREIARLMNTSQAVVAVTLHQSRSKLKKRLKEVERSIR